jgi:hypothetical protein
MRASTGVQQVRHTAGAVRGTGLAAVAIALVVVPGGLSSTPRPKPQLRLLDRAPLTVKGTRFRPGERVRIRIAAAEPAARTVHATRAGSFTMRFDAVSVGRCGSVSVEAVGARGDRASLKVLQPQDCAPGLGP